jgi:hypothetical protein
MRKALTSSELGFTTRDIKQLRQSLSKTKEARSFRRIQVVLLVAKGATFAQAAATTGFAPAICLPCCHPVSGVA